MKKKFIINILAAGSLCLVIFGIIQKSKVQKMNEKNKELQSQKLKLELENQQLKQSLENLRSRETERNN